MEAPESLGHVKGKRASVGVRDDGGVSTHAEESSREASLPRMQFPWQRGFRGVGSA